MTTPLAQLYDKPLLRVVGRDFSDTFLHGTSIKNIRHLTALNRPVSSHKPSGERLIDFLAPPEQNEFYAEVFLSEPRQPHQALMFAQGRGNGLAFVKLAQGAVILDLSDEVTRIAHLSMSGGPTVLHFFTRPAITDPMIAWQGTRMNPSYKEKYPDWQDRLSGWMDPVRDTFKVSTWQEALVPYANAHGMQAIRFADEVLITDRSVLKDAWAATPEEVAAHTGVRTWPGAGRGGLFAGLPTGAHQEQEMLLKVAAKEKRSRSKAQAPS